MRAFALYPWIPGTLKLDSILSLFKCAAWSTAPKPLCLTGHYPRKKLGEEGARIFSPLISSEIPKKRTISTSNKTNLWHPCIYASKISKQKANLIDFLDCEKISSLVTRYIIYMEPRRRSVVERAPDSKPKVLGFESRCRHMSRSSHSLTAFNILLSKRDWWKYGAKKGLSRLYGGKILALWR